MHERSQSVQPMTRIQGKWPSFGRRKTLRNNAISIPGRSKEPVRILHPLEIAFQAPVAPTIILVHCVPTIVTDA
jgi:hypothetical protein